MNKSYFFALQVPALIRRHGGLIFPEPWTICSSIQLNKFNSEGLTYGEVYSYKDLVQLRLSKTLFPICLLFEGVTKYISMSKT